MPLIKSAIKKLKQDKKRTKKNESYKTAFKQAVKKMKKTPSKKSLVEAHSRIDKAAKRGVIHKNKASRLKSQASKLVKAK